MAALMEFLGRRMGVGKRGSFGDRCCSIRSNSKETRCLAPTGRGLGCAGMGMGARVYVQDGAHRRGRSLSGTIRWCSSWRASLERMEWRLVRRREGGLGSGRLSVCGQLYSRPSREIWGSRCSLAIAPHTGAANSLWLLRSTRPWDGPWPIFHSSPLGHSCKPSHPSHIHSHRLIFSSDAAPFPAAPLVLSALLVATVVHVPELSSPVATARLRRRSQRMLLGACSAPRAHCSIHMSSSHCPTRRDVTTVPKYTIFLANS